jgi:hypothetical protein
MSWMHRGSGGIAPSFLVVTLEGGEWLVSRSGRFTTSTCLIGDWVRPKASQYAVEKKKKKKILYSQDLNLEHSVDNASLYRLSYPKSHKPIYKIFC